MIVKINKNTGLTSVYDNCIGVTETYPGITVILGNPISCADANNTTELYFSKNILNFVLAYTVSADGEKISHFAWAVDEKYKNDEYPDDEDETCGINDEEDDDSKISNWTSFTSWLFNSPDLEEDEDEKESPKKVEDRSKWNNSDYEHTLKAERYNEKICTDRNPCKKEQPYDKNPWMAPEAKISKLVDDVHKAKNEKERADNREAIKKYLDEIMDDFFE